MKNLIVIGGATATGKTKLAIQLARLYDADILSADSRQFYREMSIGTAKPGAAELQQARHHFIDSLSVEQDYSVGDFERDALQTLERLFQERDIAIVTGGSGLFLRALCEGLDPFPDIPASVRAQVEVGEHSGGLHWLQEQLSQRDPAYFEIVDRRNPARLRRALEVCLASGQPYSSFRSGEKQSRPFHIVYILLELPRADLYEKIDRRVDVMIEQGLEQEARNLLPYRALPALHTVGYEEFFDYFDGKMEIGETIEKIKQHSRNYAKRQATWFRKHGAWQVSHPEETDNILRFLEKNLIRNA